MNRRHLLKALANGLGVAAVTAALGSPALPLLKEVPPIPHEGRLRAIAAWMSIGRVASRYEYQRMHVGVPTHPAGRAREAAALATDTATGVAWAYSAPMSEILDFLHAA